VRSNVPAIYRGLLYTSDEGQINENIYVYFQRLRCHRSSLSGDPVVGRKVERELDHAGTFDAAVQRILRRIP